MRTARIDCHPMLNWHPNSKPLLRWFKHDLWAKGERLGCMFVVNIPMVVRSTIKIATWGVTYRYLTFHPLGLLFLWILLFFLKQQGVSPDITKRSCSAC